MYGVSILEIAIDDQFRDAVLDIALDGTFQGACTELHVVALLSDILFRLVAQVDGVAEVSDALVETLQFHVDDPLDGVEVELVEGDDLVQAVEELR